MILQVRTLVVEDNAQFLQHICSSLLSHAYVEIVGEAQDGIEAIQCAARLQPDLILLDIGLPSLSGIEAAHRIRTLAPNARIIFLTQESSLDIVEEALNLGAWGYVIKSQSGRELPLAIDAVIRGTKFVSAGLPQPSL